MQIIKWLTEVIKMANMHFRVGPYCHVYVLRPLVDFIDPKGSFK